MIRFSQEKVLLLHQLLIGETGGSAEIRDVRLLDSALEGVFQTFAGQELYPTKEEKGAASATHSSPIMPLWMETSASACM